MIKTKEDLRFYINEDAKANGIKQGTSYIVKLLYGNVNACVYRYLKTLRKYEYYKNTGSVLRFWYRFYNRRLGLKYNLAIPINVVGYGLYIPHLEGGVIVNCKSIGNNCKINSGVVVGSKHNNSQIAEIGNNVELAVGCKVIGKIKIGNNVVVAPNAVVVKDVPDNTIVGGVPAKIIKMKEAYSVNT